MPEDAAPPVVTTPDSAPTADAAAITNLIDALPVEVAPEAAAEAAAVTPPPPPAAETVPEAKVTTEAKEKPAEKDEDLEKQLDDIKPKNKDQEKGFHTLKGIAKTERGLRREEEKLRLKAEKELEEYKASVKVLTPDTEKELEDLRQQHRLEVPETDPEYQNKYSAPLKQKNDQAMIILKSNDLKDHVAEAIEKVGGLSAASKSNATVPSFLGGKTTWSDWVESTLLPNLNEIDRKRVERLIGDALDLSDEASQFVTNSKVHAKERMAAKFEELGKKYNEGIQTTIKALGPMAQKWEYPKDATDIQKSLVDDHNKNLEEVTTQFAEYQKGVGDPYTVGKMVAMAAQSVYLVKSNQTMAAQVEARDKQIKELQERLDKVKGSASAASQSNAAPPPGYKPADPTKMMNTKQALEEAFKNI